MSAGPETGRLATYYARRAAEYEVVYQKPERQDDLRRLREFVEKAMAGQDAFELAYGTGYWTQFAARRLADGSEHEVLKNFPDEGGLLAALKGMARELTVEWMPYYWILSYELG